MHPFRGDGRLPLCISTNHHANIFGVQFLPFSGDQILISGAMDRQVQLHRLDDKPENKFRSRVDLRASEGAESEQTDVHPATTVFNCHKGRVKDVEVSEECPSLFWSVSEDGTLRQFDIRSRRVDVW